MSTPVVTALSGRRLPAADWFVERIIAACRRDAGTGQALRSALGRTPGEAVRAHRYVAAWLPDDPAPDLEWAHYTVAALVAHYEPTARPVKDRLQAAGTGDQAERGDAGRSRTGQERLRAGCIGTVLGQLDADAVQGRDYPEGPRAPHLHALMREDLPGLHAALPGVMRLACASGRRPDWAVLLHDLADWERDSWRDATALRWAGSYYKALTPGHGSSVGDQDESEY
ncbi:type I-E CRISPR-associated protein Cse2/CasB [Streptomyces misionensis]|uniref:type I-E CRISPR-associated protein Cse2/CasB n=1 Tax=Streptomyces misionensis TaxID=67331 RepID=UPI00369D7AD0